MTNIVEFHKEHLGEEITYYDVCQGSDTYDWVEHEVGQWRDKSIDYVNQKMGIFLDHDKWVEEVHHVMFFGTTEDEFFIPEDLFGMFESDKDWEHFWNETGVLHNTVMYSLWEDLVDSFLETQTEPSKEDIG